MSTVLVVLLVWVALIVVLLFFWHRVRQFRAEQDDEAALLLLRRAAEKITTEPPASEPLQPSPPPLLSRVPPAQTFLQHIPIQPGPDEREKILKIVPEPENLPGLLETDDTDQPTRAGEADMLKEKQRRRVFLKLPYLGAAGRVNHANINIFQVESVREVGDVTHQHTDVYMTSGKVWQTPWTEDEVFTWMQEAYLCPELIPDRVRVLELKKD